VQNNLLVSPADRTGQFFSLSAPNLTASHNAGRHFILPGPSNQSGDPRVHFQGRRPYTWFRPRKGSPLVKAGATIPGITDGPGDTAGRPDIGAIESDSSRQLIGPSGFGLPPLPATSLPGVPMVPGLSWSRYTLNGSAMLDDIRDMSALVPQSTGNGLGYDTSVVTAPYSGILFEGYLSVPAGGTYQFSLTSRDASRLDIDNQAILENDGWHDSWQVVDQIALAPGLHRIRIYYASWWTGGSQQISLTWRGPGMPERAIAPGDLFRVGP
jgi:hypothetical protein